MTNEAPFINIPNYPAEEDIKAEINKLPHKIMLNVNEVAKEVALPRSEHRTAGRHHPLPRHRLRKGARQHPRNLPTQGRRIVELNLKALAAGKEIAEKLM